MWSLVVFSYAVPSAWCDPVTEQLIITVESVLIVVVLRRTWRQMEVAWLDDLSPSLTDRPSTGSKGLVSW